MAWLPRFRSSLHVLVFFGLPMPAWFNIFGGTPTSREDSPGIEAATRYVHSLIDEEVRNGTPPERIILGGFSMVGSRLPHCFLVLSL